MTDRRNPLAGINLNLFPVLDAMLRHRSVTQASRELGVTPSAVSHALRELRTLLDDPLFVRSGTGMMPTHRAMEVEIALRAALGSLGEVVQRAQAFDPAASDRVFTIATSDETLMAVMPRLFARLRQEAPNVGLSLRPRTPRSLEMLEVGELDILLRLSDSVPAWADCSPLDAGDVVCIVRSNHPLVGDELTMELFCSLPHVRVSPQGFGASATEQRLAELGLERNILVYTHAFATAPEFVAASDAILTLPRAVAEAASRRLDIRIVKPPFETPGFQLDMVWHQGRDDAALKWLRGVMVETNRQVQAEHGP